MDTTILKDQIRNLGFDPSEALVAKVLDIHLRSVSEATIKKAFRDLDRQRAEAAKAAKAAKKAGEAASEAAAA